MLYWSPAGFPKLSVSQPGMAAFQEKRKMVGARSSVLKLMLQSSPEEPSLLCDGKSRQCWRNNNLSCDEMEDFRLSSRLNLYLASFWYGC